MPRLEILYSRYLPDFDAVVIELTDPDAAVDYEQHFRPWSEGGKNVASRLVVGEGVAAALTVQYSGNPNDDRPRGVRLDMVDGLTPTMLQRFPWGRWLAVADAERRGDDAARWGAMGVKVTTDEKRPGRKGHDKSHYEQVAKKYLELRAKGNEAPAKQIAREFSYNENTVRGWIRRCREMQLLPPARSGRAG